MSVIVWLFVPEDYWVIKGSFDAGAQDASALDAEIDPFDAPHQVARFKKEDEATQVMEHVEGAASARVSSIEKRSVRYQLLFRLILLL